MPRNPVTNGPVSGSAAASTRWSRRLVANIEYSGATTTFAPSSLAALTSARNAVRLATVSVYGSNCTTATSTAAPGAVPVGRPAAAAGSGTAVVTAPELPASAVARVPVT